MGLTGQECLLRALSRVPDPRDARGVRHRLPAVMAMSIAAVLAGSRSFSAIGQWIADAKQKTLKALGARHDPDSGRYVVAGAFQPVTIDLRRNVGRYEEANVWMRHAV